jgi:ribosomal protein S12 methylthiotransferase
VVSYIDMPLQHAADGMLRRMRRGHGGERLRQFVETVRTKLPDVVFRTAFIVGHPGESDSEFEELYDFVSWARFNHVGVFHYSDEPTSHSFELDEKVEEHVAQERAERLMALQREISREKNEERVGQQLEILVEGPSEESELVMQGRWRGQAPDIDGNVYVSGGPVYPGRIYTGVVEQATDYDLMVDVGELDDPLPAASVMAREGSSGGLIHRQSDGRVILRTV